MKPLVRFLRWLRGRKPPPPSKWRKWGTTSYRSLEPEDALLPPRERPPSWLDRREPYSRNPRWLS